MHGLPNDDHCLHYWVIKQGCKNYKAAWVHIEGCCISGRSNSGMLPGAICSNAFSQRLSGLVQVGS